MKVGRRIGASMAVGALVVLATGSPAGAALGISVPSSANLGAVPSGSSTISSQLGAVTVTASGLVLPSYTASVSTTTFTTGAGAPSQTIGKPSLAYWSGPATSTTGVQNTTPGQANAAAAQVLTASRTAFSSTGLVLSISTTWRPTFVVTIPSAAVAGTYSGTVTHSVA